MQVEIDVALALARAAAALDVDDVLAVQDRHVDRVPRLVAQLLQVGSRDLADLHRVDGREAEVEHARPEPVLARERILLQVAEHGQRRDVAMRGAAAEADLARQLAAAEQRPARLEGRQDREAALERLRETRVAGRTTGRGWGGRLDVPHIRTSS